MEKKQNVPALRFQGFSGEWERKSLENITEIIMGQSPDGINYFDKPCGKILVQGNADLKDGWVVPRIWTTQITKTAQAGDLIMSVRAPAGAMGKTAYDVVIGRGVAAIKGNDFIYHLLVNLNQKGYWKNFAAGSTFEALNGDNIRQAVVSITNLMEQSRIGEFFETIDRKISSVQYKIQKLKQFRQAMLMKFFPGEGAAEPELRFRGFSDKWRMEKFSKLVFIERGGSPRPIDSYITNAEDGLNWVKIGDAPKYGIYITHTAEKIKPAGLSMTRQVYPGDLILSNSMSFGRPYIMTITGCIHDGWLLIRNSNKIFDLKFLYCLLGSPNVLKQYKALAAGSAVNNLNKALVGSVIIQYPSMEEQKQIGKFFDQLDSFISLQQKKLERMQRLKGALLEKMFV